MHVVIQRITPSIGEGEVQEFERAHGLKLPDDYRRFLIEHNGGVPQNNSEGVRAFFCLGKHAQWGLEQAMVQHRDELPAGLCPVASDQLGNLYCVACAGDGEGAVYLWDRKGKDAQAPLSRAADSFGQFLDSLEPFDPDDMPEVHEEDWEDWLSGSDAKAPEPAAIRVNVKRRARHWSERIS